MKASVLIGKRALRTAPISNGDHSFSSGDPIIILAATEHHIVFRHTGYFKTITGGKVQTLDSRWVDDNWTDYDELMRLAGIEPEEDAPEAVTIDTAKVEEYAQLFAVAPYLYELVKRQVEAMDKTPAGDMNYCGIEWLCQAKNVLAKVDA